MNDSVRTWGLRIAFLKIVVVFIMAWFLAQGVYALSQDEDKSDTATADVDSTSSPEARPRRKHYEQDAANLRAAQPEIQARATRIAAELATLPDAELAADHWAQEWAGEYYVGDGLGMNVRILVAPDAGISYTWHGCMGLYDGNHGDIASTFDLNEDGRPDGLKINWVLHPKTGYDFDSENYYFVRWAGPDGDKGRRYLVPEAKMLDMVNHFNQGGYARDRMRTAPLRHEQGDKIRRARHPDYKPFEGVPQLPDRWAKLLLLEAVDAKVTHVTPITTRNVTDGVDVTLARVTLDKGSADGLYLGMEVRVSRGRGTLTVDKLQEHTAEAEFRAFTSAGETEDPPSVDDVIRVIEGKGKKKAESEE